MFQRRTLVLQRHLLRLHLSITTAQRLHVTRRSATANRSRVSNRIATFLAGIGDAVDHVKFFTLLQFQHHAKFGGSVSYRLPVCRNFQKLRVGSRPVGIRGVPDLYKHVPPPYVPNLVAPGQTVREYIPRSTGKTGLPRPAFQGLSRSRIDWMPITSY